MSSGLLAAALLFAADAGASLPLADAIAAAYAKNPQVEIAAADAARARTLVKQGYALFYPTLDGQGTMQWNDRRLLTPETEFTIGGQTTTIPQQVFQPWWTLRYQVQAQQNLSFHGPAIPLLRQAKAGAQAASLAEDAVRADVAFAVARAYYAALTADTVVAVTEEARAAAAELLRVATVKRQNGRATEAEVLRAKLRVAETDQALASSRRVSEEARETLADLIGRAGPFALSRPARPSDAAGAAAPDAPRAEVAAARAAVGGAAAASSAAVRQWYPTLGVRATYGGYESSDGKLFGQPKESYSVVALAQVSIFDGTLKYWQVREAREQVRAAKAREEATTLAAEADERRARRKVAATRETEGLAKERLALATKARELVSGQYELGVATQLERLDADSAFAAARREAAAAELDADLAVLELRRALGLALDP